MWGRRLAARAPGVKIDVGGVEHRPDLALTLSSGRIARLAPGSVLLTAGGGATILATAVKAEKSFVVDFRARAAALGIIPRTFPRKELAPAPSETLTSRLIDRSLRPAWPSDAGDQQLAINVTLLSSDRPSSVSIDALAVNAASAAAAAALSASSNSGPAALHRSPSASFRPVGAVRLALVNGALIAFPSLHDIARSDISLFVASRDSRILSLGIDSVRVPVENARVMDILESAMEVANVMVLKQQELIEAIANMRAEEGRSDFPRTMPQLPLDTSQSSPNDEMLLRTIAETASAIFERAFVKCREFPGKAHRAAVITDAQQMLVNEFPAVPISDVLDAASGSIRDAHRRVLLRDSKRMDGRALDQVRPIRCETSVLPGAVHGSALFERGDTQVLACATIGLRDAAQKVADHLDTIDGLEDSKSFFVHYSFPGYCTGDSPKPGSQATSRREVGHAALAESALRPLVDPSSGGELPYATRVSAEVTSSDGSSSMATVCAASLALMDAGVDVKEPVAGVAMGLVCGDKFPVEDESDFRILSDILGAEDYFGAMDCKVAGTTGGITAVQLDVKPGDGLPSDVFAQVLEASGTARRSILDEMNRCVSARRDSLPDQAPRTLRIPVDRQLVIKQLLRDRAAVLKEIELASGARLILEREPFLRVDARNLASAEIAKRLVNQALADIPVGTKLVARVVEAKKSYAILETSEGSIRGMLHASRMSSLSTDSALVTDAEVATTKENDGSSTNQSIRKLHQMRFPDVRHRLKSGDLVDVVVVESCRARDVLRFCLAANRQSSGSNASMDLFLDDLRNAPTLKGNLKGRGSLNFVSDVK